MRIIPELWWQIRQGLLLCYNMRMKQTDLLQAIKYTILTCASTHLLILYMTALWTGNYELVNLFNILDLELLLPGIEAGPTMFWASNVFGFALLGGWLAYVVSKRKSAVAKKA